MPSRRDSRNSRAGSGCSFGAGRARFGPPARTGGTSGSIFNAGYGCVAADDTGNFVVVWGSQAQDGSSYGIFGQRFNASGSKLGPEFPVNTYTTSDQRYPSVAVDADGDAFVTWNSYGQDGKG